MMNNILEVRGLRKTYGSFALKDVSFELPGGYIMGFVGPNGSGKTTTIKLILGAIYSEAGSVALFGRQGVGAQNGQIGVVMDTPLYADDWTVNDVEKAISPFYRSWDRALFAGYLRQSGIEPKKKVKELSRGMKVKLQIAAALSHDARLLILDEPTSGLDPVARDEICDLLRGFVSDESKGVLFSTHITSDLEKTADYLAFIMNGSIVFAGAKDEILEKYARVSGGIGGLSAEQQKLVIGYRAFGTGFEGMVEAENIGKLPRDVLVEGISLDELIIFYGQGGKN
jgi:ABC-2 type transport system ATP-binding protein